MKIFKNLQAGDILSLIIYVRAPKGKFLSIEVAIEECCRYTNKIEFSGHILSSNMPDYMIGQSYSSCVYGSEFDSEIVYFSSCGIYALNLEAENRQTEEQVKLKAKIHDIISYNKVFRKYSKKR